MVASGNTMPINPLLSTARAHAAQNANMCPSANANTAPQRKNVSPMSSVLICPSMT